MAHLAEIQLLVGTTVEELGSEGCGWTLRRTYFKISLR
jgi:hypothetical protein